MLAPRSASVWAICSRSSSPRAASRWCSGARRVVCVEAPRRSGAADWRNSRTSSPCWVGPVRPAKMSWWIRRRSTTWLSSTSEACSSILRAPQASSADCAKRAQLASCCTLSAAVLRWQTARGRRRSASKTGESRGFVELVVQRGREPVGLDGWCQQLARPAALSGMVAGLLEAQHVEGELAIGVVHCHCALSER